MNHPLRRACPAPHPIAGRGPARSAGFSLIELAIGLAILALATVGMIAAMGKQAEQRKFVQTRSTLETAREAVLAFASANGRLPCPANAASNGQESIASNAGGIIACTAEAGFLPAVSLGMTHLDANGLLADAWEDGAGAAAGLHYRALRYGVSSLAAPVANALTSPALGQPGSLTSRQNVQAAVNAGQALHVCRSAAGIGVGANRCGVVGNVLANNAAAVIWSRGINGNDPAAYSADERQNANQVVNRVYVMRTTAPSAALGANFDDLVTWIAYPLVAERLLRSGFVL
ncbi:MAG: type II secretion system protein [Burkholderiaceae bacterium]